MASQTELRIDLRNGLTGLREALEEFAQHVRREARAVWVWKPGETPAPRVALPALSRSKAIEAACRALLTIKYDNDQEAHESRIAPGLIVLDAAGIKLAEEVNGWKDKLAAALKAMNGLEAEGVIDQETGERGPRPLREVALEALNSRRLHYRQAIRKITVLRESAEHIGTPRQVGFSWSRGHTVRRTTREALIEELATRLANGVGSLRVLERDLQLLKDLPAHEPLAIKRLAPMTIRANVCWPARDGQPAVRISCSAVAPIVMMGEQLPEKFRPLDPKPLPADERERRHDTQLEDTRLLTTAPVFRYLRNFREAKHAEIA